MSPCSFSGNSLSPLDNGNVTGEANSSEAAAGIGERVGGPGRSLKSWLALSQADTSRLPPDTEKLDPRWIYNGGVAKKDSLCVNIN